MTAVALGAMGADGGCKLAPSGNVLCSELITPVTTIIWSWQSLLGSVFTLLAAVYGACFVLRQIHQADDQEKDHRDRRR